uniref:Uncharacterized protein n=1 Tax=Oryza barthii TaxID=65489 RepID=A0A0D3EQZ5_9ORYZ
MDSRSEPPPEKERNRATPPSMPSVTSTSRRSFSASPPLPSPPWRLVRVVVSSSPEFRRRFPALHPAGAPILGLFADSSGFNPLPAFTPSALPPQGLARRRRGRRGLLPHRRRGGDGGAPEG